SLLHSAVESHHRRKIIYKVFGAQAIRAEPLAFILTEAGTCKWAAAGRRISASGSYPKAVS
ncbi:MAG: hypothetical protein N2689_10125, partial [Verrucomicrobiae bacterium]|nr:hypothetical protein [Verrucomicrobiae bacterium]